MKELNVYDFDGTIYDGDSSVDFYLYSLKSNILLIRYLPIQVYGMVLYMLKIKSKEYFKEKYFSFLKGIKNVDEYVKNFWDKNNKKIKYNLLEGKENIVVISASPDFLLAPICSKIKVEKLIATKVNKKTGKFEGKNCHGEEKVKRLNKEYDEYVIKEFYSDSKSDEYLAKLAKNSYLVKKYQVIDWK